jgi:hypothetical protein
LVADCRKGFPAVLNIVGQLVDSLYAQGATATVDVDAALKREVHQYIWNSSKPTSVAAQRPRDRKQTRKQSMSCLEEQKERKQSHPGAGRHWM